MFTRHIGKALLGAATGAAMMAGLAAEAVAQDHTIKIVFLANTDDEDYDGSLVFKDFVESRSNGTIAVEIYPGGQLCGNPGECLEALQFGIIEVFITTIGRLRQHHAGDPSDGPALHVPRRPGGGMRAQQFQRLRARPARRGAGADRHHAADDHRQHRRLAQLRHHRHPDPQPRPTSTA